MSPTVRTKLGPRNYLPTLRERLWLVRVVFRAFWPLAAVLVAGAVAWGVVELVRGAP